MRVKDEEVRIGRRGREQMVVWKLVSTSDYSKWRLKELSKETRCKRKGDEIKSESRNEKSK